MDSRNSCNNINRNTSNIFNHIRSRVVRHNLVTPEIFVSEIWMQEDAKNGVEIFELNSSNSEVEETPQEPADNFSQAWSYVNHDRFRDTEKDLRINKIAREKRRKKNEEEFAVACASEYIHDHDTQTNFNGFHYIDNSEISAISREHMNCFTILNNHVINSDSSSDNEYARVDEIEPYFTENNNDTKYWDHVYRDDIITYNSGESINAEKRTVWIYSFKNKPRLCENDLELVNISSKDSSDTTASPLSDEEFKIERSHNVCRIASPIPATFIPRLDLSLAQTLSTVTELSEIKESSKESLVIKPINNWFTERNIQKSKTDVSNVVNWMALSPRERRRRFKNTNSDRDHENQARKETFTYAEGSAKCEQNKKKLRQTSTSVIQVDVEVHANDIADATPATDIEIVSVESYELEPKIEKKKVDNTLSIDIAYADADTEIDNENGDFNFNSCITPSIQLTMDKTYGIITDPIEKLDSNQWIIGEENTEEQTVDFDYLFDTSENIENENITNVDACDSASKRLWVKNAKLMKSPLWAEYLPITGTPQSLHISLSLSSIDDKKSWFKRIVKYFKCCK